MALHNWCYTHGRHMVDSGKGMLECPDCTAKAQKIFRELVEEGKPARAGITFKHCMKHMRVFESDESCTLCERDKVMDLVMEQKSLTEGASQVTPDPLTQLQDEISGWADGLYPHRTYHNAMTKLVMEEIPEILRHPSDPMEWADAFILLLDAAKLQGVDIAKAVREKMAINRRRVWSIDPSTGVMRHVRNQ